jgi:hypothetical protein
MEVKEELPVLTPGKEEGDETRQSPQLVEWKNFRDR